MSKQWFKITASSAVTAEIYVLDEIGSFGVSAEAFITALRELKTKGIQNIKINIDSPGGDCEAGFSIYDMMREFEGEITANVIGTAASMASVILLAADKRTIAANGRIMIHRPTAGIKGNPDDLAAGARIAAQFEERIVALYVERTGMTDAKIRDLMKSRLGTWFFGKEAVEAGFVDSVNEAAPARAFKNEWAHLFTVLPSALFDTRQPPIPSDHPTTPDMKAILALAALAGITVKGDETEDQLETLIKAHKPKEQKFEMNLEDSETKKLFAAAVKAGIDEALPGAVKTATKPFEDEMEKLRALITNGQSKGSQGAPPVHGKGGDGEGKKKPMARSDFNSLPHAERNEFMRAGGKLID